MWMQKKAVFQIAGKIFRGWIIRPIPPTGTFFARKRLTTGRDGGYPTVLGRI